MPIQKWNERIWVVQLSDEPLLSEDLLSTLDQMKHLNGAPTPHIVLDLAGVSHFNSSNISQLLRLRKLAIDRGVHLRIASVGDVLWAVFMTTGLDKIFSFTPDVPNALAGLQMDE